MASRQHKKKQKAKRPSRRHNKDPAATATTTRSDELKNDFWLPTIKRRRRFSNKEIKLLQKEFNVNCSPCTDKIEEIANLFSTDKKIITTWFQNKRAKTKKLQANSPQTVSSLDNSIEQDQQEEEEEEEEEGKVESEQEEPDEEHFDFDDTMTELSSSAHTDMDSDTFQVMNGYTALTTPTYVLHQQEHQNVIATLSSPHYTHKHLSDYFSTYRFELYYLTMQQDQEDTNSYFTHSNSSTSSNSSTTYTPTTTSSLSDLEEQDDPLWDEVMDSPSSWCE